MRTSTKGVRGGGVDFYLFAIHPSFPTDEVIPNIRKVFKTDNYVAFHALNAFADNKIIGLGIIMCCIRFQKNGRASIFYIEDIHKNPQNAAKIQKKGGQGLTFDFK